MCRVLTTSQVSKQDLTRRWSFNGIVLRIDDRVEVTFMVSMNGYFFNSTMTMIELKKSFTEMLSRHTFPTEPLAEYSNLLGSSMTMIELKKSFAEMSANTGGEEKVGVLEFVGRGWAIPSIHPRTSTVRYGRLEVFLVIYHVGLHTHLDVM